MLTAALATTLATLVAHPWISFTAVVLLRARCPVCDHEVGIKRRGGAFVYRVHGNLRTSGPCPGSERPVSDGELLAASRPRRWDG